MAAIVLHESITLRMVFSGILVLGATVLATYGETWTVRSNTLTRASEREASSD
jgi:hypothetical protein